MVKRALIVSVITEAVTTLAMLLTFRLAAENWGESGLSEWVLARRVVTLIIPAAVFGLDVALTLAIARQLKNASEVTGYIVSGIPPVMVGASLIALLMFAFPAFASTLLFGSSEYQRLLLPVAAMIYALAIHVVIFAFLRGTMHFVLANLLHFLVYGVAPIAAILLLDLGPGATLGALAAFIAGAALLFGLRWMREGPGTTRIFETGITLVRNGIARVPAAFGLLALFGIPPLVVVQTDTLVNAAFMSLGMSIVTIAGSAFSPLATVVLPLAARARAKRETDGLLSRLDYLIPFAVAAGLLFAVLLLFAADKMALALIGRPDATLAHVFRWTGLAAAPYIYFVCARPVVDAHTSSVTVTRLVVGAGLMFVACVAVGLYGLRLTPLDSAIFGHVCSMYALALGAFFEFRRVVRAGRVDAVS